MQQKENTPLVPEGRLPRSTPEAEGIPSSALIATFEAMKTLPDAELHGVMVLRHGKVVSSFHQEPFRPEYKHTVYSCSKTFTALAVGLAVDQGLLRLRDRLIDLLHGYLPVPAWALPNSNLSYIRVEDLLTMRSGIVSDWTVRGHCEDWLRTYLSLPVVHVPGEVFDYDSMCSYILSAIIQKVKGQTLLEFLQEELFTPMGITDVDWEESPEGINTGGWGLRIRLEDFAKVGQLFLNKGQWNGVQLVSAEWLEMMASPIVETRYDAYGYQMWACAEEPGACRMDGILGQYVLIYPHADMVVAITEIAVSGGWRYRGMLEDHLFPYLSDEPLPAGEDCRRLQELIGGFRLPLPSGEPSSCLAGSFFYRTLELKANAFGWRTVTLHPAGCGIELEFTCGDSIPHTLDFTCGGWARRGSNALPPYSIQPLGRCRGLRKPFIVAGSYAWTAPDILVLKAHWVDFISGLELTFTLRHGGLHLSVLENYTLPQRETVLK